MRCSRTGHVSAYLVLECLVHLHSQVFLDERVAGLGKVGEASAKDFLLQRSVEVYSLMSSSGLYWSAVSDHGPNYEALHHTTKCGSMCLRLPCPPKFHRYYVLRERRPCHTTAPCAARGRQCPNKGESEREMTESVLGEISCLWFLFWSATGSVHKSREETRGDEEGELHV